MAITDLTGTTWEVASGWQATSGYGKFSIECGITLPDWSGTVYGILAIGYAPNNTGTQYVSTANSIAWGETAMPHNGVTNTSTVTLEDISGADATNTSLIQWLETYGVCTSGGEPEAPSEHIEITYGGKTYTITAGQTITFNCKGKTMQDDIGVKVVEAEEPDYVAPDVTLISFTINGVAYEAEEGMTWEQWCDSEYDTLGLTCNYYGVSRAASNNGTDIVELTDGTKVKHTDVIIGGYAYQLTNYLTGGTND